MRTLIFLNRWGHVFHVILVKTDGETDYRQQSRVCMTLDEARRVVERWQHLNAVQAEDIRDNSRLDLNELLDGATDDFSPDRN